LLASGHHSKLKNLCNLPKFSEAVEIAITIISGKYDIYKERGLTGNGAKYGLKR
jgi:hypothetical protein